MILLFIVLPTMKLFSMFIYFEYLKIETSRMTNL